MGSVSDSGTFYESHSTWGFILGRSVPGCVLVSCSSCVQRFFCSSPSSGHTCMVLFPRISELVARGRLLAFPFLPLLPFPSLTLLFFWCQLVGLLEHTVHFYCLATVLASLGLG